jgi:hypothetical protein
VTSLMPSGKRSEMSTTDHLGKGMLASVFRRP